MLRVIVLPELQVGDELVVAVLMNPQETEDQLRQLCLHLLRHGACRPLWLCDVAVMLESLPGDFDWDRCLGGDRDESPVSDLCRFEGALDPGSSPMAPLGRAGATGISRADEV